MTTQKPPEEYADWETRVATSLKGADLLKAYETEWNKGRTPPLNCTILNRIIWGKDVPSDGAYNGVAENIANKARSTKAVRQSLSRFLDDIVETVGSHGVEEYIPLLLVLLGADKLFSLIPRFISNRPVQRRLRLLRAWVGELTSVCGREQTRQFIKRFWEAHALLEEEKECLVGEALENHLYDWQTLLSLSLEARTIALALLARGSITPSVLGSFMTGEPVNSLPFNGPPDPVKQKVASLAQQVVIPTRLVGAGMTTEELDRVGLAWVHPVLSALALSRNRRFLHHPILEELFFMWRHDWPSLLHLSFQGPTSPTGFRLLGIPLLRLLHMRLVLESPSLCAALANPERALVPEVLLFLLGQEGVTYSPEISLPAGSSPGWRRRWIESAGEALSSLFLEDALSLDLTTLTRFVESPKEKTPDFGAKTFKGEQIVFESKGVTNWESFCKAKRKALRQLAKDGAVAMWQQTLGWNENVQGRAFACCLFCTNGSEAQPSQFHVEDPPFAFAGLFHDGWENLARRRQYGAVLHAAGLFAEATAVMEGEGFEIGTNSSEERSLGLPDGEIAKFVGRTRDLSNLASTLGHPRPRLFANVNIFTGIEKDLLFALSRRELPAGRPFGVAGTESLVPSKIPPFGILPSQDPAVISKGLFSRLSNGSYLAVSVE